MSASSPRPGRRPDPDLPQRWRQRLQRFARSGLTVTAFCDREGISSASFYAWQRRLRHDPAPPRDDAPHFVPVHLVTPPDTPIELLLPSGLVLRLAPGVDLAWLRQVLGVLTEAAC